MAITICVLLSAVTGQEDALGRYEDQVLALLGEHDGKVVTRVRTLEGLLTEVHVLEFGSELRLEEFQRDPRRMALSDLREASIAATTVVRVEPVG